MIKQGTQDVEAKDRTNTGRWNTDRAKRANKEGKKNEIKEE
jgi:hypothetical protein